MNFITRIRKSRFAKGTALLLVINMLAEIVLPTTAMALTGGPSQPEVQSFEPVETTDMVNMFTGDFTYNIPVMYLPGPNGGYPINLAYHGGVTMDEEASWVGLGWNINAGALVRNVRGFADDANGDTLITKVDMKSNITVGIGVGANIEFVGADPSQSQIDAFLLNGATAGDPSVGLSLGVRYNNYKGFGVTMGASFSPGGPADKADWSLGLSLDSEAGVGANVNVSHGTGQNSGTRRGVGLSFDNEGLGLNFSRSRSFKRKEVGDEDAGIMITQKMSRNTSGTSGIGFSANSHMPVISYPMSTNHMNIKLKTGPGNVFGVYGNMDFSGYYNVQQFEPGSRGENVNKQIYGYENMEAYTDSLAVMDFTRENDGQITKQMPNLATPMLTYDTYNAVGQGMAGFFRPFRTDVGRVNDPSMINLTTGGSLIFDNSTNHLEIGGTTTSGSDKTMPWEYKNAWSDYTFKEQDESEDDGYTYKGKERYYYRMHGDKSAFEMDELDFIGGEDAVLTGYDDAKVLMWEKLDSLIVPDGIETKREKEDRVARNILIHKYTNAELRALLGNTDEIRSQVDLSSAPDVPEMSIFYYNWDPTNPWSPETTGSFDSDAGILLERETRGTAANEDRAIGHHTGGYKVLNEQGQYYVYGLPAYNNLEIESIFSVTGNNSVDPTIAIDASTEVEYEQPGTDKFIDKKTKAPYAHSYMLTSILGADYVDVDGNGPTDNDLGYWVRFDYTKYSDDYQWRAPFHGANYDRGKTSSLEDDKGSYIYGEKELWYLCKAETKTHVMVFTLSERHDMKESGGEFANTDYGTQSGLKMDKISLYLKEDYVSNPTTAIALQEVHFEYNYELCVGIPNNDSTAYDGDNNGVFEDNQGGKLTLKRVWFTYEGSGKGSMTPYEFEYDDSRNFEYDLFAYDRWGGYKYDSGLSAEENNFNNRFLPYVNQFDPGEFDDEAYQAQKDLVAGGWGLSDIRLPSGGTINVTYEADDYAYVQNETATQMFNITGINDSITPPAYLYQLSEDNQNPNDFSAPATRRVYFDLEDSLPGGWTASQYAAEIYDSYVEDLIRDEGGNRNLYFKNYTNLRDDIWDYVAGYAPIEITSNHQQGGVWLFGVDPASDPNGYYTRGFLTLKKQIKKVTHDENVPGDFDTVYHDKYHPMALAAWQHMRTNDPLLLNAPTGIDLESAEDASDQNKADAVAGLLGFVPQTIQMFTGVWKYCQNSQFARKIDFEKSVIRLCSPDKKKYGGGHRIRQISITDNWDDFTGEASSTYGVQYEYTTEENGEVISSGVAQYEPMHGGDEIALRYPKAYINNVPFKSDANTFYEHPGNEGYFPAPIVGYSKVVVKSLNTAEQIVEDGEGENNSGIGTTGVTVYEFYTAKDYPVIVEETEIKKAHYNLPIPIPFVGKYERKKLTAVQGYKIELNDMHGQLRSIKKYGLTKGYQINPDETSSVEYIYQDQSNYQYAKNQFHVKIIHKLNNVVGAISDDLDSVEQRMVGVEYEFFTDQRQHKSHTVTAGVDPNVDMTPPLFPIPGIWPQFSSSKTNMKTFVTNKIIFKSGLLKEIRTFDGKARVTTTNEVYDAQTGRPLIVSVNNEFEDKIYNYSHPAHWEYDRMGSAYKNIDLVFAAGITEQGNDESQFKFVTSDEVLPKLVSGDQFLIRTGDEGFTATYLGPISGSEGIIHVESVAIALAETLVDEDPVDWRVIRSGRRNHVYADAGTIVSHQLPVSNSSYAVSKSSEEHDISENIGGATYTFNDYSINRLDSVINATAVLFRDGWAQTNTNTSNPYATGEAGIWRPYRSYVYVGARSAGTSADNRNLRTAGLMDEMELFNWQTPDFENYAENWQWTSEITRYNAEAYETENVDRLGIRSAALYGLKGSQVLAVGANGGYHEIGVEDFEDFDTSSTVSIYQKDGEGNLNFFNSTTAHADTIDVMRSYKIERGKSLTAGEFILELETNDVISFNHTVKIAVQTNEFVTTGAAQPMSTSFLIPCTVLDTTYNGDMLLLELKSQIQFASDYYTFIGANKLISGRVNVVLDSGRKRPSDGSISTGNVKFTDRRAHTGKMSMRLETNAYTFPQVNLDLVDGKTYVLSAWISAENRKQVDYDAVVQAMEWNGSSWASNVVTDSDTKGKVVEGWQKLELEFVSTGEIPAIYIDANEDIYVDDIRISPKTGGIVTYVYDHHNLRLKAMLDNNNYASIYHYDEQGNLYLVKRETERGHQTISENHGNNRKTYTEW